MSNEPIVIRADSIAARLMPAFLSRRVKDLARIDEELTRNGFRVIERIGHNLKGVGCSYGFDGITEIGAALESAGRLQDAGEIRRQAEALTEYLSRVRIVPA
jgi:HPt (histidine-containing phosphotransfer) domain-containing protein